MEFINSSFCSGDSSEDNSQPKKSPPCSETYDKTIEFCVSIGLSPFQISGVINNVLTDQKCTDLTKYVSRSGIRGQIDKVMAASREKHAKKKGLKHVSFDGRRDLQAQKNCKKAFNENVTIVGTWSMFSHFSRICFSKLFHKYECCVFIPKH